MAETDDTLNNVMADTVEKVLFHLGRGIAQTQMELDRNSIATQVLIDNTKELAGSGIRAPWYHLPDTTLELQLFFSLHKQTRTIGNKSVSKYKILAAPVNAQYKNLFTMDAEGSSKIQAKIVSIPAPTEIR